VHLKNAKKRDTHSQGDADLTDPLGQSQELYRGLKRYGVETEMVVTPASLTASAKRNISSIGSTDPRLVR